MTRVKEWDEVIQKFKKKLSNWKAKALSVGGRLTLIKSVLGSIAIYYMSIFKTPTTIIKNLESIRNNFFLGADLEERKLTWVKWSKVMASRSDGGLGVGSLFGFNRALLYKWKWRFLSSPEAHWVKIIKCIFGEDGAFNNTRLSGKCGSIWVNIIKANRDLEKKNIRLDELLRKNVGDGKDTRFWDDIWLMERPLKDLYSRVYRLDVEDGAFVADRINMSLEDSWLRRAPRGGAEFDQWTALRNVLNNCTISHNKDKWVWQGDPSGMYTVSSTRMMIDKAILVIDNTPTRWQKEIPIKINVFIWRLLLDKLPTRENLMVRGIQTSDTRCGICDRGFENILHIVWECQVAQEVWALVARWWQIDLPSISSIRELYLWLDDLRISILCKSALSTVVASVMWSLWNFRNEMIFGTEKPKKSFLFDSIVSYSFLWMYNRNKKLRVSWIGFLCNPLLALNSL